VSEPRVKYVSEKAPLVGDESLDEEGFRKYCLKRGSKEERVQENIEQVKELEAFLKERKSKTFNNASPSDVKRFAAHAQATNSRLLLLVGFEFRERQYFNKSGTCKRTPEELLSLGCRGQSCWYS
jgi:hypothetical protein